MPRRSKDSKKSSTLQLEKLYQKCHYCNTNRPTRRFDKHQKACKTKWEILHEQRTTKGLETHSVSDAEAETLIPGSSTILMDVVNDLPLSPSPPIIGLDNFVVGQIGKHRNILYVMPCCNIL